MTDTNIAAHEEMKALITTRYERSLKALNDLADMLVGKLVKEWEDKGGCKRCNGTRSILTWSTLDGGGYDEHGPCPDCTEASKAVGMKPTVHGPHRSAYNYTYTNLEVAKKVFTQETNASVYQLADDKEVYEKCITNPIVRGDYIIVTKGRKIPVGSHGMVVAVSQGSYGPRCGFIGADGKLVWIALTNVERCLGMDGATKLPAIEGFIKNDNDYRTSKKLPLKNHDPIAMMLKLC